MENKHKELGQFFTPETIVQKMLSLKKNKGTVLEPSCGDGAFSDRIHGVEAIEYDETVAPRYAKVMDFFDYPVENKFSTIIGNPPYVRYKDILMETKKKQDSNFFDERTNLYMFFIKKSIDHLEEGGELIFITPREFLKATSSIKLNKFIYKNGTITDFFDLGDSNIFKDASPNVVIFRFEKDNFTRKTNKKLVFKEKDGLLFFTEKTYNINFSDLFFVKVGAVSGADKYFEHPNGNRNFVCSKSKRTGETRRMFYETPAPELKPYKNKLLERKLKHFDEKDWFRWGRKQYESESPRIYVNSKTRDPRPFFTHPCKNYDGSVLAIFPKNPSIDLDKTTRMLNDVNWEELGFVSKGRFFFSQKALENSILPDQFKELL